MFAILAAWVMATVAATERPVLVRGDIVEERLIESDVGGTDVMIGNPTRVRVRVRQTLIGKLPSGTRSIMTIIPTASRMKEPRDIYLLVERDGKRWRGVHWADAASGICIPDDYALERGVAARVAALKKQGVVACD